MRRAARAAVIVIFVLALAAAGTLAARRYMPTKEAADIKELFPAQGERVSIVWNSEVQEAEGLWEESQVYLPLNWVNESINERFYWDAGEELLVYALPDQVVYADPDTVGSGGHLLLVKEDGVYLSAGLVANYTDIRSVYFENSPVHGDEDGQMGPRRIFIDSTWGEEQRAETRFGGAVRRRGGVKSPVITEVSRGTGVTILNELDNWSYVRTDTGFMGYMHNWNLKGRETVIRESAFQAPVYESQSLGERVSLVWHQVTNQDGNARFDEMFEGVEGVNVVSPTWFALTDNEGNFRSLASGEYVEKAHARGMEVWALLDNFSDPELKARASEELARLGRMEVPSRSSYFGIVDLAGFPKDRYYLYQSRWRPDLPMVHILPHWTWPGREGEVTPVHVYTSGDSAELFINGKSCGVRKKGEYDYRLRWDDVRYEPGTVKVVAYKDGRVWAEETVATAGKAMSVELLPECTEMTAGKDVLAFVSARITDRHGNPVPGASHLVEFSVEGPARIAATDNGDPTSHASFQSHSVKAFNGLALVILESSGEPGTIKVKAKAKGLGTAVCRLSSSSPYPPMP